MARTRRELLERDLIDYPEERGEILLEIAHAYLDEGDGDSAVKIWRELIAAGGEDGDYARAELAEWLFNAGDDAAARSELAALKASRRTDGGGWSMAAELLEERGELAEAHEWFTMATTRLSPADLETVAGEFGWTTWPGMLIGSRRRVRTAMGLPPDDTDRLLPSDDAIMSMTGPRELRAGDPHTARLLFWPRSEYAKVQQRWPSEEIAKLDEAEYYRRTQLDLQQIADEGAVRVLAVPAEAADYTDDILEDAAARRRYLDDQVNAGRAISWPPGRNQPCWCGSAAKYKKCCDRPSD